MTPCNRRVSEGGHHYDITRLSEGYHRARSFRSSPWCAGTSVAVAEDLYTLAGDFKTFP